MLIRHATIEDADAIATLYVRTRREAYAHFFPPAYLAAMSEAEYGRAWRQRLSGIEPLLQTFVGQTEGGIAGFTRCGVHDGLADGMGEIEFMYVAPEHQRTGLGSKLMVHAEGALAAKGLSHAVLWVYRDNERARRFYERCGWTRDGAEQDREIGGMTIPQLRYRRTLM